MKTFQPKAKEVKRNWHLVDAKDQVLGRVSTEIAKYLMGKQKPTYSSHMDSGDFVVVVNARGVKLTGNKEATKTYISHSGYPGGLRELSIAKLRAESPDKIVRHAVSGMLPDNRLKSKRLARLKIFADKDHTYADKFTTK